MSGKETVMSKRLTQKRLKELLHYDPITGIFIRLKTTAGNAKSGDIAGYLNGNGYRMISIDGKKYTTSRLAWLYVEGYFPENEMDHRNRIRSDNRWKNLRHVSHQCNLRNCDISKNNKSGITGIHWDETRKKCKAQIMVDGKCILLGRFNLKTDAARARWEAEVEHDFPNCNTTSTAYLYLQKNNY